jgi:tubulin-specific chaperone D
MLNAICKVRGVKVITRFLNNEPRYLEPMLHALLLNQSHMIWQERYIVLLWLSHLVLTPFDLQSISYSKIKIGTEARLPGLLDCQDLPDIATALLSAGLENLVAASKEREAASHLIVRIALRPDMQRLGLLESLVRLMFTKLQEYTQKPTASMYECLGYLSVLSGIVKSGSTDDILPCLATISGYCLRAATADSRENTVIRASAPARKALVTTLRTLTLHSISLDATDTSQAISDDTLFGMMEETIQYLLDALGDKDTPVRLAASKALSMLSLKLNEGMKVEVVQAVLDTLEEDVLYEQPDSGESVSITLLTKQDIQRMSRNLTAVNPLKWQGLLLTLGHLVFRRTAPADQLSPVLKSLLLGLDFEQRSASGTSLGGSVRDAACFGFWSLARKYATSELQSIEASSVLPSAKTLFSPNHGTSVLQIIANVLVVSACLDPSGNIRRGSSAALQELVGRHPDTIFEGIGLVQVVDYHAVARRSRAMLDVARGAAELADVYRRALLDALLGWRGVRAVDDDSRRTATAAINTLVGLGPFSDRLTVLDIAQKQLGRLPMENSKAVAETRHGLLLMVSRMVDTMDPAGLANLDSVTRSGAANRLQLLWKDLSVGGQLLGNMKARFISELILEAAANLVSSLARAQAGILQKSSDGVYEVLDICLTRADHEVTLAACADAAFELFCRLQASQRVALVANWLDHRRGRDPSFSCKGRILALGTVYRTLPADAKDAEPKNEGSRGTVFAQLSDFSQGEWPIETQVIALRSLTSTIRHLEQENIQEPLCAGLDNYTNDQRGDVGSLARLEAVKGTSALMEELTQKGSHLSHQRAVQPLVQRVVRLAGEKLDKLRFEAWRCIEGYMTMMHMHFDKP